MLPEHVQKVLGKTESLLRLARQPPRSTNTHRPCHPEHVQKARQAEYIARELRRQVGRQTSEGGGLLGFQVLPLPIQISQHVARELRA